jgi:hypothetical protein
MRFRSITAVVAASAWVAATSAAPATACSCGEVRGPVVAQGTSPHGVTWKIRAHHEGPRAVAVDFSLDPPGYDDAGFSMGLPLPVASRFVFTAVSGSGLDPFREADLSGVAARRVEVLVVRMSSGPSLRIPPAPAPWRLRKRFDWLRGLRFFDAFFAEELDPVEVTALDGRGRVLTRRHSYHGLFAF